MEPSDSRSTVYVCVCVICASAVWMLLQMQVVFLSQTHGCSSMKVRCFCLVQLEFRTV